MPKTRFIAFDPEGRIHTRSSEARTYTHTVVYKEGRTYAERRAANVERTRQGAEEGYTELLQQAQGIHATKEHWRGPKALQFFTDFAIEYLAKHPSREVYVRDRAAHAQRIQDDYMASRSWAVYSNAGWCGRRALAEKLAATLQGRGYEDIQILEAQVQA